MKSVDFTYFLGFCNARYNIVRWCPAIAVFFRLISVLEELSHMQYLYVPSSKIGQPMRELCITWCHADQWDFLLHSFRSMTIPVSVHHIPANGPSGAHLWECFHTKIPTGESGLNTVSSDYSWTKIFCLFSRNAKRTSCSCQSSISKKNKKKS